MPLVIAKDWGNARSRMNKETGLAPDRWGAYERNEFSKSRGLHLPIGRMLNSLTWYLIFDVKTASLCCKLVYSLISLPASLEQFSQSSWDAVSLANKITLYFLVVITFLSQQGLGLQHMNLGDTVQSITVGEVGLRRTRKQFPFTWRGETWRGRQAGMRATTQL